MRNKLVVFEGIDGVGKTTLARALQGELTRKGIKTIYYENCEKPDRGFNILKPFIRANAPIDSSLFFYIASSIYKSCVIRKLLKKQWVICDRFIYSTLAGHRARGANLSLLPPVSRLPIVRPDFLFLVVVDEKVRLARIGKRKNNAPADYQQKQKGSAVMKMEDALKKYRPIIIDNSRNVEETKRSILEIIAPSRL